MSSALPPPSLCLSSSIPVVDQSPPSTSNSSSPPLPNSSFSSSYHKAASNKLRTFAQEVQLKLSRLALAAGIMEEGKEKRHWPGAWEEEEEDEDQSRTPERMCEWMRMARASAEEQSAAPLFNKSMAWADKDSTEQAGFGSVGPSWPTRGDCSQSSGFCSSESVAREELSPPQHQQQQLVLSFREFRGAPPFVVKMDGPREELPTFREFRRLFGIHLDPNKRFLFKECCEDGSAPFQWRIIDEDNAPVPIFQGKVQAECRTLSNSD